MKISMKRSYYSHDLLEDTALDTTPLVPPTPYRTMCNFLNSFPSNITNFVTPAE